MAGLLNDLLKTVIHRTGAIGLLQRWNRDAARVLMYHRFPAEDAANFARQCEFLADHYNVIPLGEVVRRLAVGEPVRDVAVITIDDGYADVYEVAFPILRRYGLPATLFVTTGFIDRTAWMPGDQVREVFARTARETVEVTDDQGVVHRFGTKGQGATEGLRTLLKRVSNGTRTRILEELVASVGGLGEIPERYRPCTWAELRAMSVAGVTVGAHTVTHPILSRIESEAETQGEIAGSKRRVEEELGTEATLFAYPNGTAEDLNALSVGCVRQEFAGAVTAIHGMNGPGADVHLLLRLPCDPVTPVPQMARMLAGPLRRRPAGKVAL